MYVQSLECCGSIEPCGHYVIDFFIYPLYTPQLYGKINGHYQ
jgi:hypothetical protein